MSTMSYVDRFLEPVTAALSSRAARAIVNFHLDAETQSRIDALRVKANDGTLTPEEDTEYKEFVEAIDIISIIQSKAHKFLAKHPT